MIAPPKGLNPRTKAGTLFAAMLALVTVGRASPADAFCSVFDDRPCVPSFCSVFDPEPCLPEFDMPLGGNLRLTIGSSEQSGAATEERLNTIRDVFAALRRCWIPPDRSKALPAMTVSIRFAVKRSGEMMARPRTTYVTPGAPPETRAAYQDAVSDALARCFPLPLTAGLGGALAGRPISVRFIENRTL